MGEFDKGKGDGHRYIHGVPDNPDRNFWNWVEQERHKLTTPKQKEDFDKEVEESLVQRAQRDATATEQTGFKRTPATPPNMHMPNKYTELAKEQAKLVQMKEQIIQDLLKNGVIHSRAEIEDYRHPNFKDNQIHFDPITKRLMELQIKMLPPYPSK